MVVTLFFAATLIKNTAHTKYPLILYPVNLNIVHQIFSYKRCCMCTVQYASRYMAKGHLVQPDKYIASLKKKFVLKLLYH